MMWVDPDRARQILLNLVMNGVKYATAAGGQVTLSFATTPQTVSIHVADTGPGIPSEQLAAIFEPFVQLANGLTERRGGVGLGLTISRDLARAMEGDLTIESTVGVGSRFTLRLPRASGPLPR
jgi:signal transduction histidine kinase